MSSTAQRFVGTDYLLPFKASLRALLIEGGMQRSLSFFDLKTRVSRCAPGSQGALRGPIGAGVLVEVVRALARARMQSSGLQGLHTLPPCHLHEASQIRRSKSQGRSPGLGC
jgi:hypothetical protein